MGHAKPSSEMGVATPDLGELNRGYGQRVVSAGAGGCSQSFNDYPLAHSITHSWISLYPRDRSPNQGQGEGAPNLIPDLMVSRKLFVRGVLGSEL